MNLRFQVRRGERVVLSGENGCGKSSILRAILQKMDVGGRRFDQEEHDIHFREFIATEVVRIGE